MPEIEKRWAAIGLGANLPSRAGTAEETLCAVAVDLAALGEEFKLSSIYRTQPVGYYEQPDFVNAAAILKTELTPEELLLRLLAIERKYGREREYCLPNGPRTLDLDLLLVEGVVQQSNPKTLPLLELPHPRLHLRRFALLPLVEIAPERIHPVLGQTLRQILDQLPAEEGDVVRIA